MERRAVNILRGGDLQKVGDSRCRGKDDSKNLLKCIKSTLRRVGQLLVAWFDRLALDLRYLVVALQIRLWETDCMKQE